VTVGDDELHAGPTMPFSISVTQCVPLPDTSPATAVPIDWEYSSAPAIAIIARAVASTDKKS